MRANGDQLREITFSHRFRSHTPGCGSGLSIRIDQRGYGLRRNRTCKREGRRQGEIKAALCREGIRRGSAELESSPPWRLCPLSWSPVPKASTRRPWRRGSTRGPGRARDPFARPCGSRRRRPRRDPGDAGDSGALPAAGTRLDGDRARARVRRALEASRRDAAARPRGPRPRLRPAPLRIGTADSLLYTGDFKRRSAARRRPRGGAAGAHAPASRRLSGCRSFAFPDTRELERRLVAACREAIADGQDPGRPRLRAREGAGSRGDPRRGGHSDRPPRRGVEAPSRLRGGGTRVSALARVRDRARVPGEALVVPPSLRADADGPDVKRRRDHLPLGMGDPRGRRGPSSTRTSCSRCPTTPTSTASAARRGSRARSGRDDSRLRARLRAHPRRRGIEARPLAGREGAAGARGGRVTALPRPCGDARGRRAGSRGKLAKIDALAEALARRRGRGARRPRRGSSRALPSPSGRQAVTSVGMGHRRARRRRGHGLGPRNDRRLRARDRRPRRSVRSAAPRRRAARAADDRARSTRLFRGSRASARPAEKQASLAGMLAAPPRSRRSTSSRRFPAASASART